MGTGLSLNVLDHITIASPCTARWEDMQGDEKSRHCGQCYLRVHNLSAMTREEAESLVRLKADGNRVCARFYRRADGTVLTRDCPDGIAAARARVRRTASRIAAALGLATSGALAATFSGGADAGGSPRLRLLRPLSIIAEWIAPTPPPAPVFVPRGAIMGDICLPLPKPNIPTSPAVNVQSSTK